MASEGQPQPPAAGAAPVPLGLPGSGAGTGRSPWWSTRIPPLPTASVGIDESGKKRGDYRREYWSAVVRLRENYIPPDIDREELLRDLEQGDARAIHHPAGHPLWRLAHLKSGEPRYATKLSNMENLVACVAIYQTWEQMFQMQPTLLPVLPSRYDLWTLFIIGANPGGSRATTHYTFTRRCFKAIENAHLGFLLPEIFGPHDPNSSDGFWQGYKEFFDQQLRISKDEAEDCVSEKQLGKRPAANIGAKDGEANAYEQPPTKKHREQPTSSPLVASEKKEESSSANQPAQMLAGPSTAQTQPVLPRPPRWQPDPDMTRHIQKHPEASPFYNSSQHESHAQAKAPAQQEQTFVSPAHPAQIPTTTGHMTVERIQSEMDRVSQSGSPRKKSLSKTQEKFNKVQESLATRQNAPGRAEISRMQRKFDEEMAKAEAGKLAQSAQIVNLRQQMESTASSSSWQLAFAQPAISNMPRDFIPSSHRVQQKGQQKGQQNMAPQNLLPPAAVADMGESLPNINPLPELQPVPVPVLPLAWGHAYEARMVEKDFPMQGTPDQTLQVPKPKYAQRYRAQEKEILPVSIQAQQPQVYMAHAPQLPRRDEFIPRNPQPLPASVSLQPQASAHSFVRYMAEMGRLMDAPPSQDLQQQESNTAVGLGQQAFGFGLEGIDYNFNPSEQDINYPSENQFIEQYNDAVAANAAHEELLQQEAAQNSFMADYNLSAPQDSQPASLPAAAAPALTDNAGATMVMASLHTPAPPPMNDPMLPPDMLLPLMSAAEQAYGAGGNVPAQQENNNSFFPLVPVTQPAHTAAISAAAPAPIQQQQQQQDNTSLPIDIGASSHSQPATNITAASTSTGTGTAGPSNEPQHPALHSIQQTQNEIFSYVSQAHHHQQQQQQHSQGAGAAFDRDPLAGTPTAAAGAMFSPSPSPSPSSEQDEQEHVESLQQQQQQQQQAVVAPVQASSHGAEFRAGWASATAYHQRVIDEVRADLEAVRYEVNTLRTKISATAASSSSSSGRARGQGGGNAGFASALLGTDSPRRHAVALSTRVQSVERKVDDLENEVF
ncbi:hypothetical protein B0T26DRAFT_679268 [Lasiosphaeria miniovina]|uniref:Uncharacterized protein n=1 Tax=Lasiosphaeria miniovina TaxID=1954250 RepID=A0AA40A690_9PEZI|nr:uncharacterized protein B0T26DRAFT_679268 [Lasiosphaeria miniovina]KAK0709918.1 hypothetical protein B0T26DRAFT_679268 [Lasiosphaeria miniovina]